MFASLRRRRRLAGFVEKGEFRCAGTRCLGGGYIWRRLPLVAPSGVVLVGGRNRVDGSCGMSMFGEDGTTPGWLDGMELCCPTNLEGAYVPTTLVERPERQGPEPCIFSVVCPGHWRYDMEVGTRARRAGATGFQAKEKTLALFPIKNLTDFTTVHHHPSPRPRPTPSAIPRASSRATRCRARQAA